MPKVRSLAKYRKEKNRIGKRLLWERRRSRFWLGVRATGLLILTGIIAVLIIVAANIKPKQGERLTSREVISNINLILLLGVEHSRTLVEKFKGSDPIPMDTVDYSPPSSVNAKL